ncbi:YggT family protein [Baekduia soli]|uniref:YggT family protein n=1 Tax=Baekduia soli TaxID=496014 RepID=A0A5B8U855_9ACTN|nr:YggT family protein [Baekduia soli]QEC49125.1 YggT family protein [Baekduia soli]
MSALLVLATARDQVASFVSALIYVYTILIIAYIFTSMFFTVGGRIPYSRWSRGLLDFLRDVCEPYLAIFRRFIPPFGPLDLSPMIGIIVLVVVGNLLVSLIRG